MAGMRRDDYDSKLALEMCATFIEWKGPDAPATGTYQLAWRDVVNAMGKDAAEAALKKRRSELSKMTGEAAFSRWDSAATAWLNAMYG